MLDYLRISGVHTHSLRHQFASESLNASPRELANISQVLGHDNIETTLHFYIHASVNAEQRIGAMMNPRWTSKPKPRTQLGISSRAELAAVTTCLDDRESRAITIEGK